eukprot:g18596.t1
MCHIESSFLAAIALQNDGHEILGPDDEGSGKYWAIGPGDHLSPGDHVIVHMDMKGGLPHSVWWERYDSPNIHFEYLKKGSERVFKRHMRLMGLIPWQSKDKPARLANPPEWYGSGRDREDSGELNLTEEQVLEFKQVFDEYMEDLDGALTRRNIVNLVRAVGLNPSKAETETEHESICRLICKRSSNRRIPMAVATWISRSL